MSTFCEVAAAGSKPAAAKLYRQGDSILIKKGLTIEQKKLDIDLWIIAIISLTIFGIYAVFQGQVASIIENGSINILLRVLVGAAFQFGLAGLGIVVVSITRKESFLSHGLRTKGIIFSILFCSVCFIPNIVYMAATGQISRYLPFQSVWTTKELLTSGFPSNALGLLITSISWGFFEGFNYIVISDKINSRYPSKNKWLDWGALICAALCILIHGAIGVTMENIAEMLSIVILVYGMLIVKKFTGNAWGCIFIFVFLWNAF